MAADWWEEIKRRDFGEGGAGTTGGTASAWWRAAPLATGGRPREAGFAESAVRGAAQTIGPALGLALQGLARFSPVLGRRFGIDRRMGEALERSVEPAVEAAVTLGRPAPDERLQPAGEIVGSLAAMFLPGAGVARGLASGSTLVRGAAAGLPSGLMFGARRATELVDQGAPADAAQRAFAANALSMPALTAIPASLPGRLLTRAATGAAVNVPLGIGQRFLEREAVGEAARDLTPEPTDPKILAMEAGLGALFGAALGPRAAGVRRAPARETGAPPTEASASGKTPGELLDLLGQAETAARARAAAPQEVPDAMPRSPGSAPAPQEAPAARVPPEGAPKHGRGQKNAENAFARISDGVRDTIRPEGAERTVYTPDGRPVETRYALVELDDLVASHTPEGARNPRYPSELQPRERDRIASQAQIERIARELKPELLGDSPHAGEGAPIVGPDGVVESGNGRVAALARAYQVGTGERYRAFLEQEAARLGLDPAQVRAMRRPVLVRVRQTPMAGPERVRFAQEANRATVAPMAPAEQARADARLLTDDDILLFRPDDEGNVLARSNEDFLRRFAQRIGEQEAGGLMTPDGRWTKQAADRVTAAIFAKAYDDPRLVQLMAEEADPGIRNVLRALVMAAPDYARARALDPELGGLDLPRAVAEAADLVRRSRSERRALEELIGQRGLFGDAIAPEVAQIARLMDVNMRSPRRLAEALRAMGRGLLSYLEGARSGSLFDEAPPSLADLVQAGVREVQAHGGAGERQGDLLGAAQARAGEPHHPGVAPRGRGDREPSAGGRASAEDAATAGRGPEEPPALTRSPDGPPRLSGPLPDDVRSAAREVLAARQRELEAAARRTLSGWVEAPQVRIVRSVDELPFRAPHDVEGAWYRGTVWLVADNLPNAARAATVVLHEAVGHGGIRRLLGSRLNDLLDEVWGAYAAGRLKERDPYFDLRRIAETYELDLATPEGRRTAAEEYLARLAERGVENGWLRRLLVRLRNWLRRYFPGLELTRDELVELVARARGFVERGRADRGTAELVAGLSRSGRRRDIPQLDEPYRLDSPEADARLDELYVRAHEAKPEFDRILREVAEEVGGKAELVPLKGRMRAVEKVLSDYGGDPSRLKDILRGTVVVETREDLRRALNALLGRVELAGSVKNRWDSPTREGYRDILFNVRMPNGTVAEVQINTRAMLNAKKRAHTLYERARAIESRALRSDRPLSDSELAEIERLQEAQRAIYEEAAARSSEARRFSRSARTFLTSASNSSREIGGQAFRSADTELIRRGGSVSKAQASPAPSTRTGMPSYSRKMGYFTSDMDASPRHEARASATSASNSSTEIGRPSEYTPVAGKRRGGSVSKAQASTGESSRTGIPDTSKKPGYSFSLKNIGDPSVQSIARLEEAPDRYFDLSGEHRFLPLDRLVPAKPEEAVRESAARAARHMADAAAGRIPKRAPLTVRRLPDGRYEVLDGNSTLAVARASGWREVPVRVVDGEEGARLSRAAAEPDDAPSASFRQELDELVRGRSFDRPLRVGRTPRVLRALGAPDAPLNVAEGVIWKAIEKHGLTPPEILDAVRGIYRPVMVFDSATAPDALVALVETTSRGRPVVVAVHLRRGENILVNRIASVHSKDSPRFLQRWMEEGLLRYIDDEKAGSWASAIGLYLPKAGFRNRLKRKIVRARDVFKDADTGLRLSRATSAAASEPAGGRSFADWYRKRVAQPAWDLLARKAKAILGARLLVRRGMELADTTPAEFRRMLRRYRAEILRAGRLARDVMEAARELTPQERALISDYIEGELQAGVVPPQRIIEIAQRMQAALDAQAEELVRLGMLSKEARERWRGRYLPRFYSKHVLENPWDKALRAAHKRIDGTHLMGRGLYETVPKRLVDHYRKLGWEIRQPEQVDLAKLRDDDTVLMWRDFTPEERARMGEIRDAAYRFARGYLEIQKDIALGRLYEQVARRIARDVQPAEDWVRVPDVTVPNTGGLKRYGALAGKWVPADVWHALEAARGPTSDLMRAYLKALSLWKEGKTALNPVVHGNNVISTIVMADLAGVHLYTRSGWKLYREALREYLRKGPVFREAQDAGLFGTEFYGAEIREMLPELAAGPASPDKVAETVVTKLTRALAKTAGKPVSFYRRKMGRLYEAEDQFFKLLLYMDARRRGAAVDDAIDWAERWVFNYADIPEGVRRIKTWALPFFSYTYKAIPALTYAAVNYPWRFVPWIALFGELNWYAYESLYGANAREREEFERKVLPEYMRGYTVIGVPKAVRLPVNTPDGGALFLDLSRRMPLGDLLDATNQMGGVPILQPFMPNNPVLTLMTGLLADKDIFTGAEIVEESDTAWEAAQKRAEWLWRQLAPNTPFLPGTYSWNKAMNGIAAALGRPIGVGPIEYTGKDYYGREQSLPRALADVLTGTKIRRVDIELERRKRILEIERMIRQKRAEARAVVRRKSVEAMSAELADARLKKLRERIRMLRQKQDEYAGGP